MKNFTIERNDFLNRDVEACYHTEYYGFRAPENPDYVNYLKNQFGNESQELLELSYRNLHNALLEDFNKLKSILPIDCIVCTVPRAKTDESYNHNQLLFKSAVSNVSKNVFFDGTHYIKRTTNTATTHLSRNPSYVYNQPNEPMPYKGITNDTCKICDDVKGKTILLVDDIYTKGVNIDEDCIQFLYDKGADRVVFYAIGKTTREPMNSDTYLQKTNNQLSNHTTSWIEGDIFKNLTSKDFDPNNEEDVAFFKLIFDSSK